MVDTTGWPQGHYLLRLDQGAASRYLFVTVRSADNRGRIVVLTSPLTWQADGTEGPVRYSTDLSFDRPYVTGYGSAGFLSNDAGVIQLAERTGRQIGYATDYDVATNPALLSQAAAVVIGGDSRYWTSSLRQSIRTAQDAGTNVASFGASAGSRRVRLINNGRGLQVSPPKPTTTLLVTGVRPSCSAADSSRTSGSADSWVVRNATWWGYQGAGVQTVVWLTWSQPVRTAPTRP